MPKPLSTKTKTRHALLDITQADFNRADNLEETLERLLPFVSAGVAAP